VYCFKKECDDMRRLERHIHQHVALYRCGKGFGRANVRRLKEDPEAFTPSPLRQKFSPAVLTNTNVLQGQSYQRDTFLTNKLSFDLYYARICLGPGIPIARPCITGLPGPLSSLQFAALLVLESPTQP
jgi:hypothetical protein